MIAFRAMATSLSKSYPWLSYADSFIDDDLRSLSHIDDSDPDYFKFDGRQFDTLLASASEAVNRCLAYRREYYDLTAAAVRQAMEYDLFKGQLSTVRELEAAPWLQTVKRLDSDGQATASQAFGKGGDAVAKGFALTSTSASAVSLKGAEGEAVREQLVQSRWDMMTAYQEQLESRHTSPGHPLNFAERAAKLRSYIVQDYKDAICKCLAVVDGSNEIFDANLKPDWTDLDSLVIWIRNAIIQISRSVHYDVEIMLFSEVFPNDFNTVVPLQVRSSSGIKRIRFNRLRAVAAYVVPNDSMSPNIQLGVIVNKQTDRPIEIPVVRMDTRDAFITNRFINNDPLIVSGQTSVNSNFQTNGWTAFVEKLTQDDIETQVRILFKCSGSPSYF